MENIIEIDPVKDLRWDKFVESHPNGWVTHLSGWKRALEGTFRHIKGHFLAIIDDKNKEIRTALPIFEIRSWLTGNRLVSIPFATLSDPLIKTYSEAEELLNAAKHLGRNLAIPTIEIRTLYSFSMIKKDEFACVRFFKHHFLSLEKTPEELLKSFHYDRVRKKIRKVQKGKLKLRLAANEADLQGFYDLYAKDRKRLGLPLQPYTWFKLLWENFYASDKLTILLAELEGKTIGGLLVFRFKERVSAEAIGWDHNFVKAYPSYFLYWEAIKLAYSKGYRIFDFGRTAPTNLNLMDFKSRWGTEVRDLPQFTYPGGNHQNNWSAEGTITYKLSRSVIKNAPDSIQGLIGAFCYRHMG